MARILLADDETAARDLVRASLVADGHQVTSADNGAEALVLLGASHFDLLLSDIQMPEMDGLTLAEAALAANPDLRVVLMSGHAQGFQKAENLKPRLKAVLAKPISPSDLKMAVAAALSA
jgi:two-component system, cell cycle response regulator CpdR